MVFRRPSRSWHAATAAAICACVLLQQLHGFAHLALFDHSVAHGEGRAPEIHAEHGHGHRHAHAGHVHREHDPAGCEHSRGDASSGHEPHPADEHFEELDPTPLVSRVDPGPLGFAPGPPTLAAFDRPIGTVAAFERRRVPRVAPRVTAPPRAPPACA
ncbi:MAG: hypothetical protein AAF682_24950 [Planctomycetota bacterium]